jgi:hypothetical protein
LKNRSSLKAGRKSWPRWIDGRLVVNWRIKSLWIASAHPIRCQKGSVENVIA